MRGAPSTIIVTLVILAPGLPAQSPVLRRAMHDELARSMTSLRLDTMPGPYFIAYRVEDVRQTSMAATRGALQRNEERRFRRLTVEVRVGSYSFDNTNFLGMPTVGFAENMFRGFGGMSELPIDDDYRAIRRQLWLATDAAYKSALEQLTGKRAALMNAASRSDSLPDFGHAEVTRTTDVTPDSSTSRRAGEALVRELSTALSTFPDLQQSDVSVIGEDAFTEYLNSEGTSFERSVPRWELTVDASTQAPDGMPLWSSFTVDASSLARLRPRDEALARVRRLGAELEQQRSATPTNVYHGPVLLSGVAAAQVFAQVMGSRLTASRTPTSDNPMFAQFLSRRTSSLSNDVGGRVLPKTFEVIDAPSLRTYAGHYVGGFRVDDDGVVTGSTTLVAHGILKTLLGTRVPAPGSPQSTGNNQGGEPVVSTMIVKTDSGVTDAMLRKELLRLVAARGGPYGIVVSATSDGGAPTGDPMAMMANLARGLGGTPTFGIAAAVRLYPDGREEPIRGGDLQDVSRAIFRDVVAASDSATVYTTPGPTEFELPFGFPAFLGLGTGQYPSTFVVPALLFEDLSVIPRSGEIPKLPIIPPPWAQTTTRR